MAETNSGAGAPAAAEAAGATDEKTLLTAEDPEAAAAAEGAGGEAGKEATKKDGPDDGAAGEEPKGEKPAPAPVTVKVPDGFAPDDPAVAKFTAAAAEYGLDSEKAQKLADMHFEQLRVLAERQAEEHRKAVEAWVSAVRDDPDMGGARFKETLERGRAVVRRFGNPKLAEFLDASGLGSHPEFVRFAAKIGAAIREDEAAAKAAGAARSGAPGAENPIEALYTSMRKE